jgi:hypothetical protein
MGRTRTRGLRTRVGVVATVVVLLPAFGLASSRPAGAAATPTVNVGDASVWEGNPTAARYVSFPVTLSDPVTSTVTVQYHVMAGTATAGTDFYDWYGATRTLSFTAGTSQNKFVNVKVFPDTVVDDGDETFTLMILSVTGGGIAGDTTGTGTILDDDPGSGVQLAVSDVSIYEGDSGKNHTAKFWVSLSQPATSVVTVHAMTMDLGATGGSDYKAKMMDLSFNIGQIRKPFAVIVYPDAVQEVDEQFHVMLSNPANATIADDTGFGTIVNDDSGSGTTTESFTVGPFNLGAQGQAGWENESSSTVSRPSGAFAIKGMRFDMVDQNGNPVDIHDVHLHHIVLLDWARNDAMCSSFPNRFAGAGKERTALALGDDYAFKIAATDPAWTANWHVMNMSAQARTVYIRYEIDYVPYNSPLAARSVKSYWYDVTGDCTNSEYNVPGNGGAGSIHSRSRTFTAPRNGTRVFVGGHIHDGGIDITMTRSPSNEVVCQNTAEYPMPGMLHSIPPCTNATSITAGEQFVTMARYDNSAPVAGAMGIQLSYVYEP